ncbi:YeeE/YedE family protein [Phreatobacter stygius]|uniref:YeeE/YedE family protein n=1 Tax=Phreatobacter stygius TaxID=1940610 RepID=A0A4D7BBR0_9HYPH|nr:YeeE/YedE family protein [Phreatobacter stygius]QCI68175.1 YeeE/YedE family protein [Phreatobacter stygius]
MTGLPAVAVGVMGFLVGVAAGWAVQRARLCSFGAVEDALLGRDWRRMKVFGLALAVALIGTQTLVLFGLFEPTETTYVPGQIAWLGALIGAILFGIGMALVGTCAFGSLIRLGSGDLRSLFTLMVFGAVAYATLRGVLARPRIDWVEAVSVAMPGGVASSAPDVLGRFAGVDLRFGLTFAVALGLIWLVARDRRLWRAPRLVTAGIVLGLGVVAGWVATGVAVDVFDRLVRVQSLTFVSPVARGFYGLMTGEGTIADFGVMSVAGVAVGAGLSALAAREFRWEAFDDQHEMRRHLTGAVLMGFGGVLAGGCTIGQGLTAGSLMAVTWPLTVLGMILGARLGIAILVEGSVVDWVRAVWASLGAAREGRRPPAE